MDILHKIHEADSLEVLNRLRDEIHLAATYGEIDYKEVRKAFLKRWKELEGK